MQERLENASNGAPTVLIGDRALHSRYNPEREAERYIASLSLDQSIRYFILIEPGLGYCIPFLKRRFPDSAFLSLHISDFFTQTDIPHGEYGLELLEPRESWSPKQGPLQEFLEQNLPDMEASMVKVIEWRPALAVYGGDYARILAETLEFIKRIDANARTIKNFGLRWVKNFFKNLRLLNRVYVLNLTVCQEMPWIITGAGPSLEEAIADIHGLSRGCVILAAASSAPALLAKGVFPDFILATDGGSWALLHLYESIRAHSPGDAAPVLVMTMNAAIPSHYATGHILPVADGSLWQHILLTALGIPFLSLPQRGTVTASALDLAAGLHCRSIILAGMDLDNRDIKTHAHPYSFNRLQEESATRLAPRYSQGYLRAKLIGGSGSASVYRDWFKRRLARDPVPIYSLGKNHPLFEEFAQGEAQGHVQGMDTLEMPVTRSGAAGMVRAMEGENRISQALGILQKALEDRSIENRIIAELAPLLYSGSAAKETTISSAMLMQDLREICAPYLAAQQSAV